MADNKRRRAFKVYRKIPDYLSIMGRFEIFAEGVLYDEGNVQVLWRKDVGWTAEQYDSIAQVFGIVVGTSVIELNDYLEA